MRIRMEMASLSVLALLTAGSVAALTTRRDTALVGAAHVKTYRFVNGRWFDGKTFVPRTFYSVSGRFTRAAPRRVDETLDLQGGFVVPPYGDAHNHMFDSISNQARMTAMYLGDGIFYSKVMTNSRKGAQSVRGQVNMPTTVDVVYANGGLTGNNSHPIMTYEALGLGYYSYADQQSHKDEILRSRKRENDCYYIIDTAEDLERKWPLVLAGKPDFIKVYLLHSEDYEKRKAAQGYGEGIDPKVLPLIVARAHRAGLTVSAHVDSAADYRTALHAGVDEMGHLPGYYVNLDENVLTYALSPDDTKETARRGVHVTPTANLTDYMDKPDAKQKTQANQIRNLKLLKDAGVLFSIGTDSYGTDARKEALYLSKLGVWSNLEMLKMWCETTPHAIFPRRKIGYLRDGYEASFLVLDKNPLDDFANTGTIRLRFKQGMILSPSK